MVEKTSNHFDPNNAYKAQWNNVNDIARDKTAKERKELEKYNRSLRLGGETGGASENLDLNQEDQSAKIVSSKKE